MLTSSIFIQSAPVLSEMFHCWEEIKIIYMVIIRMNSPVTFCYMKGQFYSRYFISPSHILLSCHFKSEQHFIFPFTATCRIKYLSQIRKKRGREREREKMLNAGKGYNSTEINRTAAPFSSLWGYRFFFSWCTVGIQNLFNMISFHFRQCLRKLNYRINHTEGQSETSLQVLHACMNIFHLWLTQYVTIAV